MACGIHHRRQALAALFGLGRCDSSATAHPTGELSEAVKPWVKLMHGLRLLEASGQAAFMNQGLREEVIAIDLKELRATFLPCTRSS